MSNESSLRTYATNTQLKKTNDKVSILTPSSVAGKHLLENIHTSKTPSQVSRAFMQKKMGLRNPRYAASKTSSIIGGLLNGLRQKTDDELTNIDAHKLIASDLKDIEKAKETENSEPED